MPGIGTHAKTRLATSIADLPREIVNRIITIGCEDIPPLDTYESESRRLDPFARTASVVCREWRSLVFARSNYHLWTARLILFEQRISHDITAGISRFKHALSESLLSNLDLSLKLSDDDELVERLIVHAFALVAPYSHQIRSITIRSRPLRALVSILNNLRPLPRLAKMELRFSHLGNLWTRRPRMYSHLIRTVR